MAAVKKARAATALIFNRSGYFCTSALSCREWLTYPRSLRAWATFPRSQHALSRSRDFDRVHLPHGAKADRLIVVQLGVLIERIKHEQGTKVSDRHRFTIAGHR